MQGKALWWAGGGEQAGAGPGCQGPRLGCDRQPRLQHLEQYTEEVGRGCQRLPWWSGVGAR